MDSESGGIGRGPAMRLPTFEQVVGELREAEVGEGWLARCIDAGRYVALNDRFVHALAATIRSIGRAPVVEVGAGSGELAAALRSVGVEVIPTDPFPPSGADAAVQQITAAEALRRYRPPVVLGSFVPIDSAVDRLVLNDPGVSHYLVLNARVAGQLGSDLLWSGQSASATLLAEATRWMVSRHDVYIDEQSPILTRGEVWLFTLAKTRNASATPGNEAGGEEEPDPQ